MEDFIFLSEGVLDFIKCCLCIYWNVLTVFALQLIDVIYDSYWLVNVDPPLHLWDKSHLIGGSVVEFSVTSFYLHWHASSVTPSIWSHYFWLASTANVDDHSWSLVSKTKPYCVCICVCFLGSSQETCSLQLDSENLTVQ